MFDVYFGEFSHELRRIVCLSTENLVKNVFRFLAIWLAADVQARALRRSVGGEKNSAGKGETHFFAGTNASLDEMRAEVATVAKKRARTLTACHPSQAPR